MAKRLNGELARKLPTSVVRSLALGTPTSMAMHGTSQSEQAAHQAHAWRPLLKPFITSKQLRESASNLDSAGVEVFSAMQMDSKQFDRAMTAIGDKSAQEAFKGLSVERGASEATLQAIMNLADRLDFLATMVAAGAGKLSIIIDCNVSEKGREILLRYMSVKTSDILGYNEFTREINKTLAATHRASTVSAKELLQRDERLRLLEKAAVSPELNNYINSHFKDQEYSFLDLALMHLRRAFKESDYNEQVEKITTSYMQPLEEYMNFEQFKAHQNGLDTTHRGLKAAPMYIPNSVEEQNCLLLWLQARTWIKDLKRDWHKKITKKGQQPTEELEKIIN
jgi:hypothetical protein